MHLLKQARFVLFKNEFLAVAGNVDEFGPKLHQAFDGAKKRINGVALKRGQHFEAEQGFASGGGDVVGNFHKLVASNQWLVN
jgi:hypothetical protein